MLTCRCTPLASSSRALIPGCLRSSSSITAATVAPEAVTLSSPPVSGLRTAGIRMVTSMGLSLGLGGTIGCQITCFVDVDNLRAFATQRAVGSRRYGYSSQAVELTIVGVDAVLPIARLGKAGQCEIGQQGACYAQHGPHHAGLVAIQADIRARNVLEQAAVTGSARSGDGK